MPVFLHLRWFDSWGTPGSDVETGIPPNEEIEEFESRDPSIVVCKTSVGKRSDDERRNFEDV